MFTCVCVCVVHESVCGCVVGVGRCLFAVCAAHERECACGLVICVFACVCVVHNSVCVDVLWVWVGVCLLYVRFHF